MSAARFVVVGNPIAHSRSPEIHAHFAAQFGIEMTYERQLVALGGFADFLAQFAAQGGRGLNVTLPFKRDAHDAVARLHPLAAGARAVNTISIGAPAAGRGEHDDHEHDDHEQKGGRKTEGFNTDGGGLIRDLVGRYDVSMTGANIVLLGAGGAAQGVLASLLAEHPAQLCVANRTLSRAQALVAHAERTTSTDRENGDQPSELRACSLAQLAQLSKDDDSRPDIIINATSFGFGRKADPARTAASDHAIVDAELGLDVGWVGGAFCYDMSYGAGALFHRWAQVRDQGRCADGLGMLIEQAALSFEIWHGVAPDTDSLFAEFPQASVMTKSGSKPRRFIAGAVCPACQRLDRIVVEALAQDSTLDALDAPTETDPPDGHIPQQRRCVACGFAEALDTETAPAGASAEQAPAYIPRGRAERPQQPLATDTIQVVKIVDAKPVAKDD